MQLLSSRPSGSRLGPVSPGVYAAVAHSPAGSRFRVPIALAAALIVYATAAHAGGWAQWRGPAGTGVAADARPPLRWSETENVRWKARLPGPGHSSPVLGRDRVFVTAAVPDGEVPPADADGPAKYPIRPHRFVVVAYARSDGRLLWETTVARETPQTLAHWTNTYASPSPVTDGVRVYASFGSQGVYALDRDGRVLWQAQLGAMDTLHGQGEGSSPALAGGALVVNRDHEGPDFLIALDASTGKVRWKVPREESTSWSSPVVATVGGRLQVIVSATNRARGYDLATGAAIWECGGLAPQVIPTPVVQDGVAWLASNFQKAALVAVTLDGAAGDLTGSARVLWRCEKDTPYIPTPVLFDGALYMLRSSQGVLTCLDARTGRRRFGPSRLAGIFDVYASPVAAAGRIYVTGREGVTAVIAHAPEFEPLASNKLDDRFSASAAVDGGELYLRGEKWLYCLAER